MSHERLLLGGELLVALAPGVPGQRLAERSRR
jgi:hypothetical protein